MHDAGIGGVEIQPVYALMLDDPSKGIKNLPYLSPDFLDAVSFANQTARSLGMRVDITLGSGWPYGGPHTTLALSAGRLKVVAEPITSNTINPPQLAEGESLIASLLRSREHPNPTTRPPPNPSPPSVTPSRRPNRPLLHRQPHPPAGQAPSRRRRRPCFRPLLPRRHRRAPHRRSHPAPQSLRRPAPLLRLLRLARSLRLRLDRQPPRRVPKTPRLRPHPPPPRTSRRRNPRSRSRPPRLGPDPLRAGRRKLPHPDQPICHRTQLEVSLSNIWIYQQLLLLMNPSPLSPKEKAPSGVSSPSPAGPAPPATSTTATSPPPKPSPGSTPQPSAPLRST